MESTVQATFCATLVDEWARCGVNHAVVAPGSRSTPLALALATNHRIAVDVHHDERAAAFMAVGVGLATGRPAVLLTTSGTAAAELHAAVVEAHQGLVPLIVCTADRPGELHDVGAPQTIDQNRLFGGAVRWFVSPGVADAATSATWRSLAGRAFAEAAGSSGAPGPVHVNLAFRDPLGGVPGPLPPGRDGNRAWHRLAATRHDLADRELLSLVGRLGGRRGVVIAGGGAGDPSLVHALARVAGWPVLADPRSASRLPRPTTVAHADAIVRHRPFTAGHRPEVVLRLGAPPASKAMAQWLAGLDALQLAVSPAGVWWDPDRTAETVIHADPSAVCRQLTTALGDRHAPREWSEEWRRADAAAAAAIEGVLAGHTEATEPAAARDLVAALREGSTLVVSSSMPIRDVEWYAAPRAGVTILANRGANGIDGVVSTAVGVARAGAGPTVVLVGDVALLHDSNALLGVRDRSINLVIVVIDNDGGGIFEFLPQAGQVPREQFERLFGTPHGVRVEELAAAHGLASLTVEVPGALAPAVHSCIVTGGVWLVVVRTDRQANVKVHDELNAAVAAALE
ncbi:MAG: 2-succinyl-5-enolpyruvyl-6-hydroxy-3-cyclohexene-1-carboxylic-acid synthase [Acidimicrobiales bacterium]